MRVYIWGTGRLAEDCIVDLLPDIVLEGFVESVPDRGEFHGYEVISGEELRNREYDYVVLANSHEEDIIDNFMLDESKTVFYKLSVQWDSDQKVQFRRKNAENVRDILFRSQRELAIVETARQVMPYISVQADGLKFLFDCDDNLIANDILATHKTYSRTEMHFFYEMAPKYEQGFFLDIGANIGTTSVYFRKRLISSLKYIAFEPLKDNYKILKTNCILNDCEDIQVVNMGLSNAVGFRGMEVFDGAFGSSMVTENAVASEVCNFTTLDAYVQANNIPVEDIAYLWVDVQCHELEVVEGGLETLRNSPASLYIEFNIADYRKTEGKAERFLKLLADIYRKFICYEQYEKGMCDVRDIQELQHLPDEIDLPFCNILFMK